MTQGEADVVINAVGMDGKMTDLEFLASGLIIFKEEPLQNSSSLSFLFPLISLPINQKTPKAFAK